MLDLKERRRRLVLRKDWIKKKLKRDELSKEKLNARGKIKGKKRDKSIRMSEHVDVVNHHSVGVLLE